MTTWGDDRNQATTDCNPQLVLSGSHMTPKLLLNHDDTHSGRNVQQIVEFFFKYPTLLAADVAGQTALLVVWQQVMSVTESW